jgi:phage portal protein BeeE
MPTPYRMVGFPSDGGLISAGVTAQTTLGLSSVWRCLDILSNGVSQLPWRELRGNLDLPPSRIVVQPQQDYTRRDWTSLVVSTLALFDVCYLLKAGGEDSEGIPLSLLWLDPRVVMPTSFDEFGMLPPQSFYVGQQRVTRDQLVILHRSPQPTISESMGGVVRLARVTFAAHLAAEAYASRYWQAGGSPTTVLETDAVLRGTVTADDIQARWRESRQRGPDYAAVLEGGIHAKDFGADPTAQAAVEARREMVADVGRYFGIPTRILNAPTADPETYASSEMANQDLVRYTLQNYIGAIEDAISSQLPGGRRMEMATSKLTRGTQLAEAQALQLATGNKAWMTPDEARDVWNLPPIEDPDELNPTPAPVAIPTGEPNG